VTERTPSGALTVEEIRRLHLPLTDRPISGLNDFCLCPICRLSAPELEQ